MARLKPWYHVIQPREDLREGSLDLEALRTMPHAVTVFPGDAPTPVDRVLAQQSVVRRVAVQAQGFLLLPFAVIGTEAVAVVPERLARRFLASDGPLKQVDPPFGFVDMLEAAWWHPSRNTDSGHRWLVNLLDEVAAELAGDDPSVGYRPIADEMPAISESAQLHDGGRP